MAPPQGYGPSTGLWSLTGLWPLHKPMAPHRTMAPPQGYGPSTGLWPLHRAMAPPQGYGPSQGYAPHNSLLLFLQQHLIQVCSLPVLIHLLQQQLNVLQHLPQCQLQVCLLLLKLGHGDGDGPARAGVDHVCDICARICVAYMRLQMYIVCTCRLCGACIYCAYVHVYVCICVYVCMCACVCM